jgi:hypothetical protein
MTKQRKPHLNWNEFHVIGEMDDGSLYMAHLEQELCGYAIPLLGASLSTK